MERRLAKLQTIWPPKPCPTCERRPAIVCVPHADDPAPDYPAGRCPACGRALHTVPVLIGVDCDAL
jgi:hypothetical protein